MAATRSGRAADHPGSLLTGRDAVPLVVLVLGPHMPPGNMSVAGARPAPRQRAARPRSPPRCCSASGSALVYAVRRSGQRGEAMHGRAAAARARAPAGGLGRGDGGRSSSASARSGPSALLGSAKGAGGGQGPDPLAVPARREARAPGAGHRSAVGVDVPLPGLWRRRDAAARDPCRASRRAARHLARRQPLVLGGTSSAVKADAIPGSDNVAFVNARRPGTFEIRCAELCGLWHGHMHNTGVAMAPAAFDRWIAAPGGRQPRRRPRRCRRTPRTTSRPPYRRAG